MEEKKLRSIVKTLSWRLVATLTTMILIFIFTGEMLIAVGVGVFEVITKLIFYYYPERIWNNIKWGKQQ